MSQLQVTGEAKIRDIQGPVVANSGVITALDGAASQYVRGDGTLADFPTSTGGGSSVSYYLNGSVNQGTFAGSTYYEMSKSPIIGAGTDFPVSTNGLVAQFITDANDPDLLEVPGGNFNVEFYFSVSNNTGNPTVYAELYKYDGTTFTLLGSSQAVPESINQGTTIAPYYFAIPVGTAALALTDRIAIRIYANVDGRTVTLHTENSHLCQVVTTFSKGMVSLNNLTDQSQFITTGTSGTNFAIVSSGDTHTFNLPVASATNTGKLSSTDWSTFNNKQAALSFTAPLDNTANTISIPAATSLVDGYLDNLDWVKFNTAYNDSIISAAVTGTTTKTLTLNQQDGGTITASWTDDNTDAVTSVFGRTGAVVAQSGDYTTSQVTEGTNLYFTDARARLALSAGTGISYNNTTGVITSTITQYTDALARAAISLTTTGTSGASTYSNITGILNVPTYTLAGLGGQPLATNLTSLAGLTYASTSFVKMTAAGTFALDTNTYALASALGDYLPLTAGSTKPLSASLFVNSNAGGLYLSRTATTDYSGIILRTGTSAKWFTGMREIGTGNNYFIYNSVNDVNAIMIDETSNIVSVANSMGVGTATPTTFAGYNTLEVSATAGGVIFAKSTTGSITTQLVADNGSSNGYVGTRTNHAFTIRTNNVDRVEITSTGAANFINSISVNNAINLPNNNVAPTGAGIYQGSNYLQVRSGTSGFTINNNANDVSNVYFLNGGNVGINKIPQWTLAGYRTIEIDSVGLIYAGTGQMAIVNNGYYDGAWKYKTAQYASLYSTDGGTHQFSTAALGTANAALTWIQRLIIANNGAATFSSSIAATSANFSSSLFVTSEEETSSLIQQWGYKNASTAYRLRLNTNVSSGLVKYSFDLVNNSTAYTNNLVLTNGNIGIGTPSPTNKLTISNDGNSVIAFRINDTNANASYIALNASNTDSAIVAGGTSAIPFDIYTGGSKRLTVSATGNLGLGTDAPTERFHINSPSTNAAFIRFQNTGGDGVYIGGRNNTMELYAGGANRITIGNTGIVSIGGTVSGGGTLQVQGNVNINGVFQINGTTIGGGGGSGVTGSGTTNYLTKWTGASTIGNGIMFDTGSRVGVGTTTPNVKFEILNSPSSNPVLGTASGNLMLSDNNLWGMLFGLNGTTGHGWIQQMRVDGATAYPLMLQPVGSNVLIGTTTDNGYRLQINGSASFAAGFLSIYRGSTGANDIFFGNDGSRIYIGGNTYVAGSVTATGGFFDTSDSRLKIVIKDYNKAKGIENVEARLYLKNNKKELGYFAQDVQEILPSAVEEGSDGFLTLSYSQVHTAKIAYLEEKVAQLEELIKSLL